MSNNLPILPLALSWTSTSGTSVISAPAVTAAESRVRRIVTAVMKLRGGVIGFCGTSGSATRGTKRLVLLETDGEAIKSPELDTNFRISIFLISKTAFNQVLDRINILNIYIPENSASFSLTRPAGGRSFEGVEVDLDRYVETTEGKYYDLACSLSITPLISDRVKVVLLRSFGFNSRCCMLACNNSRTRVTVVPVSRFTTLSLPRVFKKPSL